MCGSRQYRRYDVRRREDPEIRASDADRERVAQVLRDSAGEGRLEVDELEERLDHVYSARTVGELRAQTTDLPVVSHRPDRTPVHRRAMTTRFVWISVMLVVIWAATGAGYFWPMWPMLWFAFAVFRSRGHAFARATRA